MNLAKLLGSLTHIKFKGGVFGKHGLALIFLITCGAVVAIKAEADWVRAVIFLGIIGAYVYSTRRQFDFAEKHPYPAIMDGAELVSHARIVYGRKDAPSLPPSPAVVDHEPVAISQFDPDAADPLPLEAPKSSDHPKLTGSPAKVVARKRPMPEEPGEE